MLQNCRTFLQELVSCRFSDKGGSPQLGLSVWERFWLVLLDLLDNKVDMRMLVVINLCTIGLDRKSRTKET